MVQLHVLLGPHGRELWLGSIRLGYARRDNLCDDCIADMMAKDGYHVIFGEFTHMYLFDNSQG